VEPSKQTRILDAARSTSNDWRQPISYQHIRRPVGIRKRA
jgi:hypothetical protein